MAVIALFPEGNAAPGPEVRVLRAADYMTLVETREALAQARTEAEGIRKKAEDAYEERRREGFAEGLLEGKAELAAQLLETLTASVDQVAAMESQLVDVVIQSVRAILGSFDHEELVAKVVANALRLVRDEKKILLRVAAGDADAVTARLEDICRRYPGMGRVDVAADPALMPGGCVLETEIGVVDASLDRQLTIIEETYRRHLEERRS
ncbi:MAG: HrpE/YscL family type III secretion apparatus protein [Planctomycetes bacterium]|nr:HrpE/YscL family type III secretion apparatus protein [Planctomycetota bacterium]